MIIGYLEPLGHEGIQQKKETTVQCRVDGNMGLRGCVLFRACPSSFTALGE